jgi:hypothetical protein
MERLKTYQMADQVTFATLNVFGRTFYQNTPGRGQNGGRHVTLAIGQNINPGVYGALSANGNTTNIDPTTGQGVNSGGIALLDTLASVGKTLGTAIGVPSSIISPRSQLGKLSKRLPAEIV